MEALTGDGRLGSLPSPWGFSGSGHLRWVFLGQDCSLEHARVSVSCGWSAQLPLSSCVLFPILWCVEQEGAEFVTALQAPLKFCTE